MQRRWVCFLVGGSSTYSLYHPMYLGVLHLVQLLCANQTCQMHVVAVLSLFLVPKTFNTSQSQSEVHINEARPTFLAMIKWLLWIVVLHVSLYFVFYMPSSFRSGWKAFDRVDALIQHNPSTNDTSVVAVVTQGRAPTYTQWNLKLLKPSVLTCSYSHNIHKETVKSCSKSGNAQT